MKRLKFSAPGFRDRVQEFCTNSGSAAAVTASVTGILEQVRKSGDKAICALTQKFDGAKLAPAGLRVTGAELKAAQRSLTAEQRTAIRSAVISVQDFHANCLPKPWTGRNPHGATVGERFYPIERVGIYVPGGSVPLVSTVVMTCALARLAQCPQIAVVTPPGRDGSVNPGLLAALNICGINEVYRVGGAQAIGALAYGTATIPAVDKIFGPGNAYVTEAKRQVFGTVGVDLLPGPSEVMIIADGSAKPAYVAADLIAQAEHGSGKELVYLATTSEKLLKALPGEIQKQLRTLSHAKAAAKVLKDNFLAVHVKNTGEAVEFANTIAPEHLELHLPIASARKLVSKIKTAGAILIGENTPTVLGDFTAGPSHTLPTGRTGRFFSGLRMEDFYRRSSIVEYKPLHLKKAAPIVEAFAELEQLDAHGNSLKLRLK